MKVLLVMWALKGVLELSGGSKRSEYPAIPSAIHPSPFLLMFAFHRMRPDPPFWKLSAVRAFQADGVPSSAVWADHL